VLTPSDVIPIYKPHWELEILLIKHIGCILFCPCRHAAEEPPLPSTLTLALPKCSSGSTLSHIRQLPGVVLSMFND